MSQQRQDEPMTEAAAKLLGQHAPVWSRLTNDQRKLLNTNGPEAQQFAADVAAVVKMQSEPAESGFLGKLWSGVTGAIIPTAVSTAVVSGLSFLLTYVTGKGDAETVMKNATNSATQSAMFAGSIGGAFNIIGNFNGAYTHNTRQRALWSQIHRIPLGSGQKAAVAAAQGPVEGNLASTAQAMASDAMHISSGLPPKNLLSGAGKALGINQ